MWIKNYENKTENEWIWNRMNMDAHEWTCDCTPHKKLIFSSSIFSVNVTKSAEICEFGHI